MYRLKKAKKANEFRSFFAFFVTRHTSPIGGVVVPLCSTPKFCQNSLILLYFARVISSGDTGAITSSNLTEKISLFSVSEILPRCTNCVCNNLLFLVGSRTDKRFYFCFFFSKRNSIGILEKLLNAFFALRGSIPLENLRAHLHTTIGSAVFDTCWLGRPQTPTHFLLVAKERDGLLRPSLASFKFPLRFRQGFASRLCRPLTTLSLISSRFYVCVQRIV